MPFSSLSFSYYSPISIEAGKRAESKKGNITCEAGRISEGWFGCGHQDGL
jgi:hypothetical protein